MQTTTAAGAGTGPIKTGWRGVLSPVVIALGALLALQLLLALTLDLEGGDMAPAGSQGPLLVFQPDQVTAIRVQASAGESVLVKKTEGGWVIPSLGDLPAAGHRVTGLLAKLHGLQKGLPVATSEEALKRFKVADEGFERKLTLERGDEPPVFLYLGDSPGFRRLFVRAGGDQVVYDAELGLFDAPDKADNWSDRSLLHLDAEKVEKLTVSGLTLERKDAGWRLAGLAKGQEQDQGAVDDAVRALTDIDFVGVLAGEKQPAVSKDASPVEIEATLVGGKNVRYEISKLAKGSDSLLTVSNRPQRFTLSQYMAEELTGIERADLLKKSAEPKQGPTAEPLPEGADESRSSEAAGTTATGAPAQTQDAAESVAPEPKATEAPASVPQSE